MQGAMSDVGVDLGTTNTVVASMRDGGVQRSPTSTRPPDAEAALGEVVDRRVISVPTHFNELRRTSTKLARRIAGAVAKNREYA
jgi:molecular chaperone DnaK (HSP70)